MDAQNHKDPDWVRSNQERYLCAEANKVAADALQHVLMARSALMMGESEIALIMYRGANNLWNEMEHLEPGEWTDEIAFTKLEMSLAAAPGSTTKYDC